jgi:amino acid transporter
MNSAPPRASLPKFTAWFTATAATVIFTGFTLNGMRLGQTGPGSYASLVLIPNFLLLIPCAVVLLILWFKRPKPGKIPENIWKKAGIIFAVVLVILFFNDELWGGYSLRVQVLDTKHKPIPGIVIDTLAQKASWFSVFLPEDLESLTLKIRCR